jgi:glucose-6-phosphate 1-dehydrogenase
MSPFVMVIFGATGDLAQNKLFPALFSLFEKNLLPEKFYIVGFSRRPLTDQEFRSWIEENVHIESASHERVDAWHAFLQNVYYQSGQFTEEKGYLELIDKLKKFDDELGACIMRFFYLATPPQNYETILTHMKDTKLSEGCGQDSNKWTRIAIEKPFGNDLETARSLDRKLAEIFDEKQIFRVDHYLAKETVQNILAFRFANSMFEPVWKNEFIDHVQITFAEKEGIDERGSFFDGVGLLRDVLQNHLTQLVASVTMEQPNSFTKDTIRDARAKAIEAIEEIAVEKVHENVVSGQYEGYHDTQDVALDSKTETFVAMKFFVKSERFDGVPFYIRAGKKMPENSVTISLVFKQTCHLLFKEYGCPEIGNVLTIHIQPNEGITLRIIAKKPGQKLALGMVNMNFSYSSEFGNTGADAYEKLLMDIFSDDQTLFNRSDELESSWEFITQIINGWKQNNSTPETYPQGTWGPESAKSLIERDGRKWL